MTGLATLSNFLAFNAQVIAIVIAAAVLLRVLAVPTAGARYASWRLALTLCLLTPWLLRSAPAPAVIVPPPAIVSDAVAPGVTPIDVTVNAAAVPAAPSLPWTTIVAAMLLAGAALRALWLAGGLWRLRSLRRQALRADDELSDEVQAVLGTRAEIASVPELTQPVTFGVWRPVVLLPEGVVAAPVDMRRAVLTHELLHVQRRDWCWIVAEELLRTVLWFQPAIWWATSRIQLAREQVVDELTVLATGNRRGYIEALLAFADGAPTRPAPAFARRAHLFTRIVGLSKERVMSSSRVVLSGSVVATVLVAAAWSASALFPVLAAAPAALEPAAPAPVNPAPIHADDVAALPQGEPRVAPAPVAEQKQVVGELLATKARVDIERRELAQTVPETPRQVPSPFVVASQADVQRGLEVKPLTPENPIPRRLSAPVIPYPAQYRGSGARATIVFRVVLDASGTVVSVAAAAANLNGGGATGVVSTSGFVRAAEESLRLWRYQPPADPPIAFFVTVTFGSEDNATAVQTDTAPPALVARVGPPSTTPNLAALQAQLDAVRAADAELATRYGAQDPQRALNHAQQAELQAAIDRLKASLQTASAAAPRQAGPGVLTSGAPPMRVGGNIKPPQKTKHVAPAYPAEAQSAGVQGVVIVEATIDEQGRIAETRVLRSIPQLDQAAIDAVQQWEFSPTVVDGKAVPVIMTVTVQFSLN